MKKLLLSSLTLLVACSPLTSNPSTVSKPSPVSKPLPGSAQGVAAGAVSETVSETATPPTAMPTPPLVAAPSENPSAAATPGTAQGTRLVLSLENRFFETRGQSQQLRIALQDAKGQAVSDEGQTFTYASSRPQDFRVDEKGVVTAMSGEGFSDIIVRLQGSDLQASQLVSVSSPLYGGSFGGSKPPTEENVNGQIKFQF